MSRQLTCVHCKLQSACKQSRLRSPLRTPRLLSRSALRWQQHCSDRRYCCSVSACHCCSAPRPVHGGANIHELGGDLRTPVTTGNSVHEMHWRPVERVHAAQLAVCRHSLAAAPKQNRAQQFTSILNLRFGSTTARYSIKYRSLGIRAGEVTQQLLDCAVSSGSVVGTLVSMLCIRRRSAGVHSRHEGMGHRSVACHVAATHCALRAIDLAISAREKHMHHLHDSQKVTLRCKFLARRFVAQWR